jgi:hypothetical protein
MPNLLSKVILIIVATLATAILGAVVFALPVMWLWNYSVPSVLPGVRELDFWHALALGMLCLILFKGSSASSSSSR